MDGGARLRLLQILLVFLQAVRRRRTWQETDRLLVLLGGIADPELRLHRFGEHLRAQTPEEAAWTIAALWDRVAAGERPAQTVCLGLLDLSRMARVLGTDHLKGMQAALEADGDPSTGLFIPAKPRRDLQEEETAPRPKEPAGFRISLARRPVAPLLDRLLFDPDARVVLGLLPYLLHQDLRAVAAGSPRAEVRKQAASLLSQRPGA